VKEDRLVPRLRGKESAANGRIVGLARDQALVVPGWVLVHHCSSCGARTCPFGERRCCVIVDHRAVWVPEAPHNE
jgi:hypothetical protein